MRIRHAVVPLLMMFAAPAATQTPLDRSLSIDDVLAAERIDRASLSPDGGSAAVVVSRPAHTGEAYGRTSYEADPSRADIWLISTRTGERRPLTNGASRAAGYWCATWSPDGERLAMLTTAAQGKEPRGGDTVRLHVWERRSNRLIRLSDASMMVQSRYGSPVDVSDLRGGADKSTLAHRCTGDGVITENAPFLWLDQHRLLVTTLPEGEAPAAVDHYARVARSVAEDAARLRAGRVSTGRAVASGGARPPVGIDPLRASLQVIDVTTRASHTVARVPAYPFGGALTAAVSPDGTRLAILATLGALRPDGTREFPNSYDTMWTVERRLGFADLTTSGAVRWATLPASSRYPLELVDWSPDSRSVAFRARADGFATETPLFSADQTDGIVRQLGTGSVGRAGASVQVPQPVTALWLTQDRILAQSTTGAWRVLGPSGIDLPVTAEGAAVPDTFVRAGDGGAAVDGVHLLQGPAAGVREQQALTQRLTGIRGPGEFCIVIKPADRSQLPGRRDAQQVTPGDPDATGPTVPPHPARRTTSA